MQNRWRWLMWADRLALVGLGWWSFVHINYVGNHWRFLVVGGLFIAGAIFHNFAESQSLGWTVDQHGERQKVKAWNRGYPVLKTSTTHGQRIVQEANSKRERRGLMIGGALVGGLSLYLAGPLMRHGHHILSILGYGFGGLVVVMVVLPQLVVELLYQLGYQDMEGAKVLDAPPVRPGPEEVYKQKAHGRAGLATEAQARDLLKGGR